MARVDEKRISSGFRWRVRILPFSLLLPLLSLLLWVGLVAVPVTATYLDIRGSAGYSPSFRSYAEDLDRGLPVVPLRYAAQNAVAKHTGLMEGLNAEGFWVEILIDRCSPAWPMYWLPEGVELTSWRAITYPIWCLPFWALAGLGLDRLLSRRRVRWPMITLGTVLSVVSLATGIGLYFSRDVDSPDDVHHFVWGLVVWGVLFLSFPVAGVLYPRRNRRLRAKSSAIAAIPSPGVDQTYLSG
jgi:hypothetical protein